MGEKYKIKLVLEADEEHEHTNNEIDITEFKRLEDASLFLRLAKDELKKLRKMLAEMASFQRSED